MVKFNFRFQKILDLKENEKEIAKINMADAIKQEEKEFRKNQTIYNKIADLNEVKKEKQEQGVPIAELRMLETYLLQLHEELSQSNHQLNLLQKKVAQSKSHLQVKAKEEKTWVNLKDEQRNLYEHEAKLKEQNFLDELASIRYYRSSVAERG